MGRMDHLGMKLDAVEFPLVICNGGKRRAVTGPDGMKATSVTTSSTWVTSIAVPAFVLVLAMTFGLYREMAKLGMLPDVLPAALGGGQRLQ